MFKEFPDDLVITSPEPSARALADLLRHSERWPVGFKFDFFSGPMCAMGLAKQVWGLKAATSEVMADLLGISESKAIEIFICRGMKPHTPEAIARDLEAL